MKQKFDIIELIPQRPPMVMVDEVLEATEDKTLSCFTILPENVFCENQEFGEAGLIENIAQTAAAGSGMLLRKSAIQGEPPIGFIGALKNLVIHSLPKENTSIQTEIVLLHRIMNASVVFGKVYQDHTLLAECEMKIFLK